MHLSGTGSARARKVCIITQYLYKRHFSGSPKWNMYLKSNVYLDKLHIHIYIYIISSHVMIMCDGDHICSSFVIMLYDRHTWPSIWSHMMIIHDDRIWSSFMMIIYAHHIWSWCVIVMLYHEDKILRAGKPEHRTEHDIWTKHQTQHNRAWTPNTKHTHHTCA